MIAGTNKLDDENAEKIKADYKKFHEEFVIADNDIGLIHLSTPLSFNERINKIQLQNTPVKDGIHTAVLTGWGFTSLGKKKVIFLILCFSKKEFRIKDLKI